jgi:23S rRNA (pseudouridine1915-N3)-methyltransferase
MKVRVLVVGRVRGVLADAVADYETRAGRYWSLEVLEVEAGGPGRSSPPAQVRADEGARILAKLPADHEVVALTRVGEALSSRNLAAYLEEKGTRSVPGVTFVIGGAFGLDDSVLRRARKRVSISAMTLPHEMARLVLAEQLYRAGTIVRGEPYHKG